MYLSTGRRMQNRKRKKSLKINHRMNTEIFLTVKKSFFGVKNELESKQKKEVNRR